MTSADILLNNPNSKIMFTVHTYDKQFDYTISQNKKPVILRNPHFN